MILKKNRVDKNTFEVILKKGSFVASTNLTFRFLLDKNSKQARIAFVVPKTVTKSAVKRNLLRRRGYTALQKQFDNLPHSLNGVFFFGKNSLEFFSSKEKRNEAKLNLENEITKILSKVH